MNVCRFMWECTIAGHASAMHEFANGLVELDQVRSYLVMLVDINR